MTILRFKWPYPLKRKSECLQCFLRLKKLVENQFERKMKVFQCDGGGEFSSNDFINHLQESGIKLHVSCLGTSEHKMRWRLTMSFHANLPLSLWVEIFLTTVYLINRLPSSTLKNDNPYYKPF